MTDEERIKKLQEAQAMIAEFRWDLGGFQPGGTGPTLANVLDEADEKLGKVVLALNARL